MHWVSTVQHDASTRLYVLSVLRLILLRLRLYLRSLSLPAAPSPRSSSPLVLALLPHTFVVLHEQGHLQRTRTQARLRADLLRKTRDREETAETLAKPATQRIKIRCVEVAARVQVRPAPATARPSRPPTFTPARARSTALIRKPLVTQCATSFVLFGTGDVLAQQAFEKKGANHDVRPRSPGAPCSRPLRCSSCGQPVSRSTAVSAPLNLPGRACGVR